ncbi:MAG: hypothetical protein LC096_04350 [Bacteroidia bacterium]|nr:hypothetical protein [Bacteroidia bacterium]
MISKLKFMMAFAFIFLASALYAQVPQLFNYQGVARDAKGNPMSNQQISLKLTILPTADASAAEYEETQIVKTNEFGLYTLQIGNGHALTGEMKTVKWETGNKYIQVAIDPKGGNDFVVAGTSQLLSVPYALYADKAGSSHDKTRTGAVSSAAGHVAGDANYLTKFTALNTIGKSLLFDNGSNVGLGTTSPLARLHLYYSTSGILEHIRMHNGNAAGAGRFTMYNDSTNSYATFTKYGTNRTGGYNAFYPYANLLAFGNNGITAGDGLGRFLISTAGNVGISLFKSGSTRLKFHADFTTENVGIGGNAAPVSRVHLNNTEGTLLDLRLTNNTSGHTANDGLVISQNGNVATIMNKENSSLMLGTNNNNQITITNGGAVGVGTTTPTTKLDVNGQIRMQGGSPGAGKLMTSDANGVGSWSTAAGAGLVSGSGTTNYIPMFTPNGNTLGNSKLFQKAFGNDNGINLLSNNQYDRMTIKTPNGGYSGFMIGDSSSIINGYADSVVYLYKTPQFNTLIGNDNSNMLIGKQGKVQMGNGFNMNTGNAQLNVNTSYDTAGYFTSISSNVLNDGILRAEYTGTSIGDHIAIYGKSNPGPSWGVGVKGYGGWIGVEGRADSLGFVGIRAIGFGNSSGLRTTSEAAEAVYAASSDNAAIYAYSSSKNKNHPVIFADGNFSKGVGVLATSDTNKAGLFVAGNNNYNQSLETGGVLRGEYKGTYVMDAVGVYGYSRPDMTKAYGIGVQGYGGYLGVRGTANSNVTIAAKYGVLGEAYGSGPTNCGVYGSAIGAVTNFAGYFEGTLYATTGTFGTKPFMIDHPLDPTNKFLRHSSIESNDMMNIYNGNIVTDANGYATVTLPDYFEALNENFKYQLTVIDNSNDFIMAKVTKEVANNQFTIRTSVPNVKVSWQVSGVRHDAVAKKYPIIVEENKPEGQKGFYLEPEAYGQPRSMGANYPERLKPEFENSTSTSSKAEVENIIKQMNAQNAEMAAKEALHESAKEAA